jgi:DNA-binding NarL/FixJ family response regulator
MRVSGLFSPCDISIGQFVRVVSDMPSQRTKAGPTDAELLALSAGGLTLRQIAERIGLSHETVRRRLREPVEAHERTDRQS